MNVEERLQAYTETLDRAIQARTTEPASASNSHASDGTGRNWRSRTVVGGVLIAVLCLTVIALVATRQSDRRSITSTTPAPTITDPSAAAAVSSTGEPSDSEAPQGTVNTEAGVVPPTEPASTVAPEGVDGVALASLRGQAGPIALGVVPDGYRVVMANAEPLTAPVIVTDPPAPTAADGWSATYVRRPSANEGVASYLVVIIENITNGDPYWGYPDTLTGGDVTVGPFTGRYDNSNGSGYPSFISRISDTRHLVIGGRATIDDITTLAGGLHLGADGVTAEATALPTGYELVDQGSRARQPYTASWTVGYAKGQLESTLIGVRAFSHPRDPAIMRMLGPARSRIVQIEGREAVLSDQGLTIDISPTFQIQLAHEGLSPSTAISEDLIPLARTIVGITAQQFDQLQTEAAAHPLTPTDLPCGFYVHLDNARSNDPAAATDGDVVVVPAGATVIVDVSASQPLRNVTFGLEETTPPDANHSTDLSSVTLATLDQLTSPTSVELTWDGTINGTPAPPGSYTVSYGDATNAYPTPGSCNSTANLGSLASIKFVVP